jgi:glycosyltransferase involved in cell wall biosynthesis
VLEQSLGHVTHAANLRAVVEADNRLSPTWCPIDFEVSGLAARVPGWSNWTVRAGVRARRAVHSANRQERLDALFVHTQVPAVLLHRWLAKVPSVVSIDATPMQYDSLAAHYAHKVGDGRIERLKWQANKRTFDKASALVSWSAWGRQSLVEDYGISREKVTVIPPGIWIDTWSRPGEAPDDATVRILFVGADFQRKGGDTLLSAFRSMREQVRTPARRVELHIVTKTEVAPEPDVFVYHGLGPNDPELLALYHRCHIFCLPTRADMLALVLCEAAAAGLPLVATKVGGTGEVIEDGTNGILVPPDDPGALAAALNRLVDDGDLRRRMGANATATAARRFDARKNAAQIVELLISLTEVSDPSDRRTSP